MDNCFLTLKSVTLSQLLHEMVSQIRHVQSHSSETKKDTGLHYFFLSLGISPASANLLLSFYFREIVSGLSQPTMETASGLFIAEPIYNWGGFFVDGNEPSIHPSGANDTFPNLDKRDADEIFDRLPK